MAVPVFSVGQVLTAALTNSWLANIAAYKPSDEDVTSSTTLQNDNDLVVAVSANSSYLMIMVLKYSGLSFGTSDLKVGFTFPAGLTMAYGHIGMTTAGTFTEGSLVTSSDQTNVPAFGTDGTGNPLTAYFFGTVTTSATAGNLQMQWAQNTSNGTRTRMHTGSCLVLMRIA